MKNTPHKQILLYIHGFNNLPEESIFKRTEELQGIIDEIAGDKFALVVPLIWPCDSDVGIVKDYWDDQKSADASAFAFSRMFQKFLEWRGADENIFDPCLKRINLLAHSMGNRVLRQTLTVWEKYDGVSGVPMLFRNTFLVASDIVNESLEHGEDGQFIPQSSRNVLAFYASDDLALRGSKISNLKNRVASRRLGHTGPEEMCKVPSNVYAYDCDNFNNQFDSPMGHTYFFRKEDGEISPVAKVMIEAMRTGRPKTDVSPRHSERNFIIPYP
jgi:esterase/lipase superfamily enzyme